MNDGPTTPERDRRLRKSLLASLYLAKAYAPTGELGGQALYDNVHGKNGWADRFDSPDHAIRLVRDLVARGYVAERRTAIRAGEPLAPRHLILSCTDKGADLYLEHLPPDRLVEDERLIEE